MFDKKFKAEYVRLMENSVADDIRSKYIFAANTINDMDFPSVKYPSYPTSCRWYRDSLAEKKKEEQPPFNVGDRVRCVFKDHLVFTWQSIIYIVEDVRIGGSVKISGYKGYWMPNMFELVEEQPFKAGEDLRKDSVVTIKDDGNAYNASDPHFNVGDKVWCVKDWGSFAEVGDIWEVLKIDEYDSSLDVFLGLITGRVATNPEGGYWMSSRYFELVEEPKQVTIDDGVIDVDHLYPDDDIKDIFDQSIEGRVDGLEKDYKSIWQSYEGVESKLQEIGVEVAKKLESKDVAQYLETGLCTVSIAYADATGTLDGTVAIEVSNDARADITNNKDANNIKIDKLNAQLQEQDHKILELTKKKKPWWKLW
jgi:hypothetical protein